MRVLHITESALGGVGTYLNQIISNMNSRVLGEGEPAQIRLFIPESDRRMVVDIHPEQITSYRRDRRSIPDLLRFVLAARREIKRFRPDIIHLHSSFAGFLIRPMFVFRRRPKIIYCAHGWAFDIPSSPWRVNAIKWVERVLAQCTDKIVVLSDKEMRDCVQMGFDSGRLVRIYNGLSTAPKPAVERRWDDARLKVLFIGRFDRQKGIDILFDVARASTKEMAVWCAGTKVVDGGDALDLPENVTLLGWLSEAELQGCLQVADIIVMPSRWEGLPLVALEAMRSSRPVAATLVGGLPEVVVDGLTGRLVPPDDWQALREALLRDDAETRKAFGHNGYRRFLDYFTIEQSVDRLVEVYRDALSGPRQAKEEI
ncbi:MAG: glycosyltransferase [Parvibaculaceae bacterium]|nr:glycosyltransferase [Parvibaculaceae bacterium]